MVVEGLKGVLELLNSSIVTKRIYATSSSDIEEISHLARECGIEISEVSTKDMEIMSSMKKAPGVLAVGEISYSNEENLIINDKNVQYFKKVIKPSADELSKHKSYLNKNLKKNYF